MCLREFWHVNSEPKAYGGVSVYTEKVCDACGWRDREWGVSVRAYLIDGKTHHYCRDHRPPGMVPTDARLCWSEDCVPGVLPWTPRNPNKKFGRGDITIGAAEKRLRRKLWGPWNDRTIKERLAQREQWIAAIANGDMPPLFRDEVNDEWLDAELQRCSGYTGFFSSPLRHCEDPDWLAYIEARRQNKKENHVGGMVK